MPKNIVYLHGIGKIGGAEKDLISYLTLVDRGEFCPHVICPAGGPLFEEVQTLHVPLIGVDLPAWRKIKDRFRIPFIVWKLSNLFHQWSIDLVHVNDYWWSPFAYVAAKIHDIPIAVHLRQQIEPNRVAQYWLHKPDVLFPVSNNIRTVLLAEGVNPHRVHVVYSGVNLHQFRKKKEDQALRQRYGLSEHQPIVGTVANLFPRKGIEYLIEAIGEVKKSYPEICCILVGEGSELYRRQLFQLVKQRKLESNIIFVGFQEDVREFLNAFTVFVLPSILEGFGIVLLEAMAMGKPIVATEVGGIPEIITEGKTGMLVPPKDSDSLAKAIKFILAEGHVQQRLGEGAREAAENSFSQEAAMKRIETLYHHVLSQQREEDGQATRRVMGSGKAYEDCRDERT